MLYLQSMRRSEEPNRADSVDLHGMIEKALAEAERACAIVRRMRKFAERRPPERKLLDLRPLIDDAIELTMAGNRHRTRLVRNDDPRLPPVPVDPVLFQQIVVNLVRNALEAVSERKGAEIRVTTRRAPGAVELSVEDDGPGIAPEAVANLFHAFSTFKDSGLGLGLAISRTIAQNHGGDIRVDPGGNGRGATFLLTLPMDDAIKTEQTKR
jgi:two-component system sensor kinase FixL